ncbi:MAG: GAF domain-containing protein [Gammaproteobacteria bacterium]|nr:GAF domain-containing protein [Gammaproteobacteria bacterium]
MSKPAYGFGGKTVAGMTMLFLLAVCLVGYLAYAQLRTERNLEILHQIDSLSDAARGIQRRIDDLAHPITWGGAAEIAEIRRRHGDLVRDLDDFSAALANLRATYQGGMAAPVLKFLDVKGSEQELGVMIDDIGRRFDLVSAGVEARIQDRQSVANLGLVASYLRNDERLLFAQLKALATRFRSAITSQQKFLHVFTLLSPIILVLLAIVALFWFQAGVMRRIHETVAQCREVALGRSGYQAEVERDDELGDLLSAVNSLSARSHLIMTVLDEMRRTDDMRDALRLVWQESNKYLSIDWMGLVEVREKAVCNVPHAMPPIVYEPLRRGTFQCEESGLREILKRGEPLMVNDLQRFAAQAANTSRDRFMRVMAERTDLRSMIAAPMRADDGWRAVMVFASKEENHFDEEDSALMANLAQVMANGLAKSL